MVVRWGPGWGGQELGPKGGGQLWLPSWGHACLPFPAGSFQESGWALGAGKPTAPPALTPPLPTTVLPSTLPASLPGQRHSPLSQRHSPAPQCPSPSPPARAAPPCPPCQSPAPQRRSPGPPCPSPQQRRSPASPSCPSPVPQRRSPVPPPCQSPSPQRRSPGPPACPAPQPRPPPPPPPTERTPAERAYAKPPSHHVKAGFQGRRSYSEMAEGAGYAGASPPWLQAEAATLPKPRAYGGELYGPGRPLSPRRAFDGIRLRFEKQPSEEEEWAVPTSPPSPEAGTIRCASFCAGFPVPESPAATAYAHAEHAQSWPSINVSGASAGVGGWAPGLGPRPSPPRAAPGPALLPPCLWLAWKGPAPDSAGSFGADVKGMDFRVTVLDLIPELKPWPL